MSNRVKQEKIRVLVAKPGLDGHDREAGMEVIYTGLRQSPEMIVEAALQEDVDVVGLSILSGAHMELFPLIVDGLKQKGLNHVLIVAGGIIPEEDVPVLKKMGIQAIFRPGAMTQDIVDFVNAAMVSKRETPHRGAS
jgi:methylmalonyl-CoA mutase C-terminal domain/subunit